MTDQMMQMSFSSFGMLADVVRAGLEIDVSIVGIGPEPDRYTAMGFESNLEQFKSSSVVASSSEIILWIIKRGPLRKFMIPTHRAHINIDRFHYDTVLAKLLDSCGKFDIYLSPDMYVNGNTIDCYLLGTISAFKELTKPVDSVVNICSINELENPTVQELRSALAAYPTFNPLFLDFKEDDIVVGSRWSIVHDAQECNVFVQSWTLMGEKTYRVVGEHSNLMIFRERMVNSNHTLSRPRRLSEANVEKA